MMEKWRKRSYSLVAKEFWDLDQVYRIKEKYSIIFLEECCAILRSENDLKVVDQSIAVKVLQAISNGHQDLEKYARQLEQDGQTYQLPLTLLKLERKGLISKGKPTLKTPHAAFFQSFGIDPVELNFVFQEFPISVRAFGGLDTSFLEETLLNAGLILNQKALYEIWVCGDYLAPELHVSLRDESLDKVILLVKYNGVRPFIGPLLNFQKCELPCWECLCHRIRLHDLAGQILRSFGVPGNELQSPTINHPLAIQQAVATTVAELIKWIYYGENQNIEGHLLELDLFNGTRERHSITKRPQCSSCGHPEKYRKFPQPITLSAQARVDANGGYRTVPPLETYQKFKHHISSVTGIVPYLRPYFSQSTPLIHNWSSGRNMAMQSKSLFWLNLHLRSANGGKGKNELQAKVGALCEAIERYSLMYHGEKYTLKGKFSELEEAIHPNACMNFSEQQYLNREKINAKTSQFYALVPSPFKEEKEIEWTPVYSLTQQKFKYLPTSFCYAQYPEPDETQLTAYPDSNGCAAGNTLEEAILQGFLELVERDAAAIWWYNRIPRPQLDLTTSTNDYVQQIVSHYAELGRELYVLDLTTDLGIPVFASISHRKALGQPQEILYAFGAHVEAEIALERALIEMNQLLPLVEVGEKSYPVEDPVFLQWLLQERIEMHLYLQPASQMASRSLQDFPMACAKTIEGAIQLGMERVEALGMEMLVLDMTRPDIQMPVAKVMVPGLRHFWRRTAPGRLYEVPVKMGWLEQAHLEEELNPVSIFI